MDVSPARRCGRVVDQDVEVADRADRAVDESACCIRIGEVGLHDRMTLAGKESEGRLGARSVAPEVHGDPVAAGGESERGGTPDAARRPGDQHAPP